VQTLNYDSGKIYPPAVVSLPPPPKKRRELSPAARQLTIAAGASGILMLVLALLFTILQGVSLLDDSGPTVPVTPAFHIDNP
jgi:hypothetical protein